MIKFTNGASALAIAALTVSPAMAQDTNAPAEEERTGGVGDIIVTATKQSENLQDVPIAVSAIGEEALDELAIDTFGDYLEQLPSVTAGGSGPGQSTIYIRGLASTTPNLTTAGVAGLAPNVALYLDEQPLGQPGRNLDVYAADLERIEVLSGPQGTLFGASSQAGVVRLITNKPDLVGFDASFKAGVSFTKNGESSYNAEAMINVPVTDSFALRGVFYLDDQGGYIDNVAGTITARESARFRPSGTVRSNGVPVRGEFASGGRGGAQSDAATLAAIDADVNFIAADNSALVEEDFNDTQYSGFRVSALYEFSPDWRLLVSHARQSVESDGVFFADPNLDLDDLEIQRYEADRLEDDFSNTSWTVEGRLAMLDIVYTGAYTKRETQQRVDYTDYLFVGQYLPYYICDTSVSYPTYVASTPATPTGTCQAPNLAVTSDSETTVFTQELRFSTPSENRFRVTAGGFYSDLEIQERNDFVYPTAQFTTGADATSLGFVPNFPLTNLGAAPGAVGNASDGFFTLPGPFPASTIFRNDILRTDKQFGLFGEASFDIVPDLLTLTFGARYYNIEVDLEGSANSSFFNRTSPIFGPNTGVPAADRQDAQLGGTNISAQYGPNNAAGNPDVAKAEGTIFKGTITVTPTNDLLFYATYSEGFRPGLLNRPGGASNGAGFTVPFELETDEVKNYELGWKMDLADGQLRLNGSAFYVDISRLQTTIFDPGITNLFFSDNAADAEIYGLEGEVTFAPYNVDGLTVTGAFSFLDTEITNVLTPTNDVVAGEPLAYAPSFQGNMRVRYEWAIGDLTAHVMPQVVHSSSKFTDIIEINKFRLDGYTTFALSAGVKSDNWSLEIFGENLTDERAEVAGNFINDVERITTNRPLTVGLRIGYDY
ncbi:TonB-dependent receptor [Pontixanthobacter aestiaquae]|uniref:TonB-dependent receptor n=1 Tax=Pontixanthobacter aestiaquae TaxID=1509367 RepID=A0A844Z3U7_9SPHN|nr:TonB-dependent receptor plug domain-containing protein [Pontixanthobacter aestiaquae]MDN3647257.1 TonB-dependent receptor [Pontixanthobacter aestiaquae]MXO81767.1 TonB-dependent receptor [Pontixanthobacter aestiaquae]